jgi:hypothetical protein
VQSQLVPGGDVLSVVRARLNGEYQLQLEVCAGLESLAERLPLPPDHGLSRTLESILEPSWTEHVSVQEGLVFPLLRQHYAGNARIGNRLTRFSQEHEHLARATRSAAIGLRGQGLAEPPARIACVRTVRALLSSRRRHVVEEHDFLDATLPQAVSVAERIRIGALIAEHAWPRLKREPGRFR